MAFLEFIFNPFVIIFVLFIAVPLFRWIQFRREEEYYYNRMYWTMRQAQEDANKKDEEDNDQ